MASLARVLTSTERNTISDLEGFDFYSYLEVTDADGTWKNAGKLAVGSSTADFFNTCQLSDGIDQNTLSFTAVLAREIGVNYSLSPYRSDSALNARAGGTFGPILDIRRYWRLWAVAMPHGVRPAASSFRVWRDGRLDVIDVQEKPSTVTIIGRGMEADLIDAYVSVTNRVYGNTTTPVDIEDVIQAMLDDQMGIGRIPLYTPEAPVGMQFPQFNQDEGALMPQIVAIAAMAATVTRYRYDSSDTNRFTQFTPQRNPDPSSPDWIVAPTEWTGRPVSRIDISPVRNFIIVRYPDSTFNSVQEVISPAAEPTTVTVASETATFSSSPGTTIADGAILVINRVGYTVSGYTGGTTATLAGAPDVAGADWYTSASITRYGLRPLLIDLTTKQQITDQIAAGGFADAIRSDSEDPGLEQQVELRGWWFLDLWDYLKLLPDGLVQNEVVFGGVAGYTMTLQNSTLIVVASLRGKPAGGYRRWLSLGSGAPRATLLPELTATGVFVDGTDYTTDVPNVQITISEGDRCNSALLEWFTDDALTIPWRVAPIYFDRIISGNPVTQGVGLLNDTERNKTYYARVTPYSGPFVSLVGVTGIAGNPVVVPIYAGTQMTPRADFDILDGTVAGIDADLTALANEPFTVWDDTLGLPNGRKWADRSGATIDLSVPGEIGILTSGGSDTTTADIIAALAQISIPTVFYARGNGHEEFATIPAASTEISASLRRRRQLDGAAQYRVNVYVVEASAGTSLTVKYSTDGFGSSASLTALVLTALGDLTTGWIDSPPGMNADPVELSPFFSGGAGTDTVKIAAMDIEFRAALVTSTRDFSDDFSDDFS